MERWNEYILASIPFGTEYILAGISFGTEMNLTKKEGLSILTNTPGPIKVRMKALVYPHYQFTVLCDWYKSWNKNE